MIEKKCIVCNNSFNVYKSRIDSAKYCSKKCEGDDRKGENNCVCTECGKEYHIKESFKKRHKRTQGYFCSTKCVAEHRKKIYLGENNPNFRNLKNDYDGYLLTYLPKFGRIKLHHKMVFEYLNINKIPNNYCVHHRDCEINNNSIDNLVILSNSDHRWLHKNFGNATLWAYYHNKISLNDLCSWCNNPEKARKLLTLNIIKQKESNFYENINKISQSKL